jgi:2-C-methyl-D-erythritol 2,4-cyclodiphosphate synthase
LSCDFKIGFGYDVHQFAANRKLIIGGVEIPHDKGLLGHSDADVLLHALADALLGALALGDIGLHFPDTSAENKDLDSKILLSKTYQLICKKNYELNNADITVVLEKPKLRPYVDQMRKTIAEILKTDIQNISVKATTSEKLGFTGREEGVAAYATVLLRRKND